MEYTKLITQIIDLTQKFRNERSLLVKEASEMNAALEFSSTKFKESFIPFYYDEITFLALTGLNVSAGSIEYYIVFKNKLGKNYTWKSIGLVKHFLRLDDDNIVRIVIRKKDLVSKKIKTILGVTFVILACILCLVAPLLKLKELQVVVLFSFTVLLSLFLGVHMIYSLIPIQTAIGMDKRIKQMD